MAERMIDAKDRHATLRWAYALENPISYLSNDLRADFKARAAMLRRLAGATADEDLGAYQSPHPDELRSVVEVGS